MKKILFFLAVVFGFVKLSGQDHHVINFAGHNTIPETVLVINLTQGTELSIQGTDILHLVLKGVSVEDPIRINENQLVIYPNPFEQSCQIEFVNSRQGKVSIHFYDITGKLLYDFSGEFPTGLHTFLLTGASAGSYLLKVQTSTSLLSGKIFVTGHSRSAFSLQHTNQVMLKSSFGENIEKNTEVNNIAMDGKPNIEMDFWPGDEMLFVGKASGFDNCGIYDSPSGNQTYTFEFTNWYPEGNEHCFIVPTQVVEVTNPITGKTWMDRNLGAGRAATSSTDEQAYGDLYQWGRFADGHQCRTSGTTSTLSISDTPGHDNFITTNDDNGDWLNLQNNNLWQGVNGINNPCPVGYRLPTEDELIAEWQSWGSANAAGAFASPLKWTLTGYRFRANGSLDADGSLGYYWSNTTANENPLPVTFTWNLYIASNAANMNANARSHGLSVRCIKAGSPPSQPSVINGPADLCQGQTSLDYSVIDVSEVTYSWTVPSDWSITSGQGTHQITVIAGSDSGVIEVIPSNPDGNGPSQTFAVTTTQTAPTAPEAGTHISDKNQIEWKWNTVTGAVGYKWNTTNSYATAMDKGTSISHTETGLNIGTTYTRYAWAYNACGQSTELLLSASTKDPCDGVTPPTGYGVVSSSGKCWLDRNLGAQRVAVSSTDHLSYGELFQWGRAADGHQEINWTASNAGSPLQGATSTKSSTDTPPNALFITSSSSPYDWRIPQNDNLWQGVDGINNPCPDNFRLPTQSELNSERLSWISNDADGAFASPLKLPLAGMRFSTSGSLGSIGSSGWYWTSTGSFPNASQKLWIRETVASMSFELRAHGLAVRCIMD